MLKTIFNTSTRDVILSQYNIRHADSVQMRGKTSSERSVYCTKILEGPGGVAAVETVEY